MTRQCYGAECCVVGPAGGHLGEVKQNAVVTLCSARGTCCESYRASGLFAGTMKESRGLETEGHWESWLISVGRVTSCPVANGTTYPPNHTE